MPRQLAPWFGGKAALSPQIVAEFGPHRCYFEPFAGGFGVIFNKPACRDETLNDLHQDVTHLARVLSFADQAEALQAEVDRRVCCETLDREARERLRSDFTPTITRAADFFCVSWMATGGCIGSEGTQSMAHGYGVASKSTARKLRTAAASLSSFHQRLKGVTITNRDGFALLEKIHDDPGIVIYCDPPYVMKNGRYQFDFDEEHHRNLAQVLQRFRKARVVVSYTDHPVLDQLYAGWTKKRLNYQSRTARWGKVKKPKPPEILLINAPSLVPAVSGDPRLAQLAA